MQVTVGSGDGQAPAPAETNADGETGERRLLLGRFALVRQIGQGGMGVVYTALDELLGRAVAIKMIRADRAGAVAVARILREAQALARLSHPNVVQLHDVRTADGQLFLAMEYVPGRTLRAWLEQRPGRAEILARFAEAGRGLAAAHAAGLVHRDFKPDNVLVGDDGRVRVVDFGLVAADEPARATLVDAAPDPGASDTLTRAGAVVGTPAYMAPEQLRGEAADARSDQFAFCVALFEALHGRRPFARDSDDASREATLRGEVIVPHEREVPTWLRAVLLRGLSVEPSRRWPDMPALLAAIARDPQVARRQALRNAGLLLLVGAVAVLLGLGAVQLQRRWAREREEAQAFARLAGLEETVRRAEAEGDGESAAAAFRAFIAEPQHQGTRALALAWMRRGDQQRSAGDSKAGLAAYAEAYAGARDPADAAAAMRAMAGVFHGAHDGPALARSITALRASVPAVSDDPVLAAMAADAALLLRDLPAAADEQRRAGAASWPWDALSAARPVGIRAREIGRLPPGGSAAFAALHGVEVTLLDEQLREVGRVRSDRPVHLLAPPWLLAHAHGELALLDPLAPEPPRWRGPAASAPVRGVTLDLGGPAPDVLVGFAAPVRGFQRLTGVGGPAAALQVAHAATDQIGSDLRAAVVGDFDGDGARELIAAVGAWKAYDLRVFAIADDGALRLRARRRIGRVPALVAFEHAGERLVAALKDDRQPNPELFPEPPHTGGPAGVHLLRWTGAALTDAGFVPLRRRDGVTLDGGGDIASAADLDGDGADELVFPLLGDGRTAMLVRADADGWRAAHLGGMAPLAAAELDGDPARELLVALTPDDDVWALGVGDDRLPTLRPRDPDPRPVPAALADPLLTARWTRADELAAVGLPASAAASLQDAAHFSADRPAQLHLQDRAAELWLAAGDDAAALRQDRVVAGDPAFAAAALARQAATLTRLGRFDEAHAAATARLALADDGADRATVGALKARLDPLIAARARVDLDFSAPLDPAWDLPLPAALRRDPGGAGLAFALVSDPSPAARLPLAWDGGPLALEFSAEVAALEYAACLRITVEDATGTPWLGAAVCGRGGGGELTHAALFTAHEPTWHELPLAGAPTGAPRQVHVRVVRIPGGGVECTLEGDGAAVRLTIPAGDARPASPAFLTIGSRTADAPPTLATGVLRRLTLRGAGPLPGADDDPARAAAHALVEGDPAAVQALLAPLPDHPLWRALVRDELHDPAGAAAELSAALEDMSCATCPADLVLALRTRPALAAALRGRIGAAALPLLARAWSSLGHHHRRDPATRRGVLAALAGVEALTPDNATGRAAQRDLLGMRARLWEQAGSLAWARRDLLAALAVPSIAGDADAQARADLHAALARLLVDTDPVGSYAHARAALEVAPSVEGMRMQLADTPTLAARAGEDPAWRRLFTPTP